MSQTDDLMKLNVLLPHWAEHNTEHAEEFLDWAIGAERIGYTETAAQIRVAAQALEQANKALEFALLSLQGGRE